MISIFEVINDILAVLGQLVILLGLMLLIFVAIGLVVSIF